jgi:hypothetical protein
MPQAQTTLFELPPPDHCLYQEWTATVTNLRYAEWAALIKCGRSAASRSVCKACPEWVLDTSVG